ncbi:AraC family transcriptional regulator [Clostridium arbusti]|uniref:AraC family transcriptional regulator n=1 Tax=Clostridium arbusti TaxID=1137848 RepID=UPI000287BF1B|nr:AraC family transcriptional regulator [Clostridium arbusti]
MDTFFNNNRDGIDLVVYECGMEKCSSGHYYGPAIRDHFLIHYVLNGKGKFHVDNNVYDIHKGQGFLICPDVVTYYEADFSEPWEYAWIGFSGVKAEYYLKQAALDRYNPIFTNNNKFTKECLFQMMEVRHLHWANEVRLQGFLYILLSELIESAENHNFTGYGNKDVYIKKFIEYVERNYSRPINIKNVAEEYLCLNRSYFSDVFKNHCKQSPQEFIIKFRIKKACELMNNYALSISEISHSVGYNDPLTFSKVFKKIKGCCPKEYRMKNTIKSIEIQ